MKGHVLILIIVNIVLNVDAEIQSVEVTDGDEAMLLFKAASQENSQLLDTYGLHWHIQMKCLGSSDYVNIMLDDGDQTKSFRMKVKRKIDLLPLSKLSENSSLSIVLQTRSEKLVNITVNVTISTWFTENQNSSSKGLEAFIDKPAESSPSINYFYTSQANISSSLFPSLSLISLTPLSRYILVNVEQSPPYTCGVVSLQDAATSPADNEALIKRVGIWQTMLQQATFIINAASYPEGFYIVVVEAPEECGFTATEDDFIPKSGSLTETGKERNKRATLSSRISHPTKHNITIPNDKMKITIKENSPISNYWIGPGVVCCGYLLVFCFSICIVKYVMDQEIDENFQDKFNIHDGAIALKNLEQDLEAPNSELPNSEKEEVEGDDKKTNPKLIKRKRMTDKTVDELCKCNGLEKPDHDTAVFKRNQLHWVILVLTGMFYYLPTIQMVLDSSNMYKVTGNQDYCFYNSLCQRPLLELRDFNHIFSNLGYAVLGLLFMWVVYKKEQYCKLLDKDEGVPRQYSLFYAMGLSLIGVGVMSSCYHVCPTNVTFQFDTTYMYMLAFFMFLKIYQNRHPDLVCSAVKGFLFLGLWLCLEVASLYFYGPAFWTFFTVCYIGAIFSIAVYTYSSGEIKMDYKVFFNATMTVYRGFQTWKQRGFPLERIQCPRRIFVIILLLANLAICIYFAVYIPKGLSSILLYIFIGNLIAYTLYYITMKIYCGEKLKWHCIVFLVFCLICMLPALYFFEKKEKNSTISPAESRSLNRECAFLGFYDQHDIWHFLGGYALFFMFMFLLTLDDDLLGVPHEQIPVF